MNAKAKTAQKAAEAASGEASALSPVRILVACSHGQVNQVVELDSDTLAAAVVAGHVDPHPSAVAYALSLTEQ